MDGNLALATTRKSACAQKIVLKYRVKFRIKYFENFWHDTSKDDTKAHRQLRQDFMIFSSFRNLISQFSSFEQKIMKKSPTKQVTNVYVHVLQVRRLEDKVDAVELMRSLDTL